MTKHLSRIIPAVEHRAALDLVFDVLAGAAKRFEAAPVDWISGRLAEMRAWREGQHWQSSLPEMDKADYQWPGANKLAVAVEDAWLAIFRYRDPLLFQDLIVSCLTRALEAPVEQHWGKLHEPEWTAAFDGREFIDPSVLLKLSMSCEAARFRSQEYLHLLERIASARSLTGC